MGSRIKRHKGFMKGNRMLPIAVVVLVVAAIVLTSVFILKQSFHMILTGIGPAAEPGSTSAASLVSGTGTASETGSGPSGVTSSVPVDSLNSTSIDSASWFNNAMFVGDSITLGIQSYRVISSADVYATNAMSTASALKGKATFEGSAVTLADAVKSKKPSKIFLLLGSNDETYMTEDSFISNYEQIIDMISAESPSTQIYVQSIFPVLPTLEKKNPKYSNENIDSFNNALSAMCASKGVTFKDTAALFKDTDGAMKSKYSGGGVNIKRSAYFVWLNYLSYQG